MKTTMCNIPEEVLTRQLMIETIPSLTVLIILLIATVLAFIFWWKVKDKISPVYSQTALIAFCLVSFVLWYKSSFIATKVATNLFNSEYAVLVKFTEGCLSSLK